MQKEKPGIAATLGAVGSALMWFWIVVVLAGLVYVFH